MVSEITLFAEDGEGYYYYRERPKYGDDYNRNNHYFQFSQDINFCQPHPIPDSKALFVDGEVWILAPKNAVHYNMHAGIDSMVFDGDDGFIGELTIGASGDIIIPQDIVMAESHPYADTIYTNCTSVLGLISEKHILMWRNCDDRLVVHAGMAAVGSEQIEETNAPNKLCPNGNYPENGRYGTISMDGINCYTYGPGGEVHDGWQKDQLLIHGCLIMRERGLIHTSYISGVRGFDSKKYKYDKRFQTTPPPHFFKIHGTPNCYFYPNSELANLFGYSAIG